MSDLISRWLPGLCLLTVGLLNWPFVGYGAFERVATDSDILEIADAALAAMRTPSCPDRRRNCPVLLHESTWLFCPSMERSDALLLRCNGQRPAFMDLPSRYVRVRYREKQRLVAANITPRRFECRDGRHYQCMGRFDRDAAFADGWKSFYQRHPDLGGLAAVSVPAIGLSRRHAAIYVAVRCGGLCGYGFLLELERQASGWKVVRKELDWVS